LVRSPGKTTLKKGWSSVMERKKSISREDHPEWMQDCSGTSLSIYSSLCITSTCFLFTKNLSHRLYANWVRLSEFINLGWKAN
jgi:hypothetical protein